jgi:hypothetical protein
VGYEIKERSLGELLDAAFQIYRNHFRVFVGVTLCVVVPSAVAVALVTWAVTGSFDATAALAASAQGTPGSGSPPPPDLAQTMRSGLASMLSLPIHLLGSVLQDAVLTLTVADAYLGRPISVRSGFQRGFQSLWPLLGASLLKGLGVVFGILCFVIPGILLTLRWLFSTQAIIIEKSGGRASLTRSGELTRGDRWRLLLLVIVMAVIGMGLHFAVQAIVPNTLESVPVIGQLLQYVPQIVVSPVSSALLTLAYFDLRVKKEGFDLERLAQGLGEAPGVAPQGI